MTDKAAADLRIELDAMRLARAEDHRSCARLAARVKELERRESAVRDVLLTLHASHLAPEGAFGKIAAVVGFDEKVWREYRSALEGAPRIAEGTRNEAAARCAECGVPVPQGAVLCAGPCGEVHR